MSDLPPGFSLNMGAFTHPKLTELKNGKLVTGLTKKVELPVFIKSDYPLGYIFGAFLSCGIANLTDHKKSTRGITIFKPKVGYPYNYDKLEKYFKKVFNLNCSHRDRHLYIYNVAVTKLLKEFGVKQGKHLPQKYRVNNDDYNQGLIDGMDDFHALSPDVYTNSPYKRRLSKFVLELYNELTKKASVI